MSLIQIQELSLPPILRDISFTVSSGELVVLVGKNGSGKTTLLRCLSGWHRSIVGHIEFNGQLLSTMSPVQRSHYVSALPQRLTIQEHISVQEWIAFGRFRFNESHHQSLSRVKTLLKTHQMSDFADRSMATLSGGEAQRIGLIAMMSQESQVWLLDEPANHLDPKVQFEVYHQLGAAWLSGQTMLLTTHNINLLTQTVPHIDHARITVIGIADGTVAWKCPLNSETLSSHLSDLYECTVSRENGSLLFYPPTQGHHES
jgi:iron complex transport system ATP-binding protein